jgi:hypothetical protein
MTESEWAECHDPNKMLAFLRKSGQVSERKLRLYSVACCLAIWTLLTEKQSRPSTDRCGLLLDHERRAVGVAIEQLATAERYADGMYGRGPVDAAYREILHLLSWRRPEQEPWAFTLVAALRATSTGGCYYGQAWEYNQHDDYRCAGDAANYIARVAAWATEIGDGFGAMYMIGAAQLRDILGPLPFRTVHIDPPLLWWHERLVVRLAQAIYDERRWWDMPILADALLDAGCDNEDILQHCREQEGVHSKGCWVIDLLLEKE